MTGRGNRKLVAGVAAVLVGGLLLWRTVLSTSPVEAAGATPAVRGPLVELSDPGAGIAAPSRAPTVRTGQRREAAERSPGADPSPGQLLASGTVRDGAGNALAGALVGVGGILGVGKGPGFLLEGGAADRLPEGMIATTDAGGRFALRGPWKRPRVRVLVARQGYAADQRVVDVGETELVFRLEASALTGRARLAEGVSARRVRVEVRPPGAPVEAHAIASATLRVDGCFEIEELAPGRYELAFLHEHRADPLLMMGPFEIPVADPRFAEELESVDLRHLVRRLSFRVQREDGKPLGFGWLRWGESDPAVPPGITEQIHSGLAQLDTPWPLIAVWVDAPPLRRAELEVVSAGCRIDLVSPTGSVLELDRTCELADAELVLYLKKPHLESIRLSFRDSRTRPVTLEAAGSWTLEWWLIGAKTAEEDGTIHYGFSERVPPPAKPFAGRDHLVVAEDQVPQRFVVSPDPCGLAALLENHR